jgi:hypothetical protein
MNYYKTYITRNIDLWNARWHKLWDFRDWGNFHARTDDYDQVDNISVLVLEGIEEFVWQFLTEECYIRLCS